MTKEKYIKIKSSKQPYKVSFLSTFKNKLGKQCRECSVKLRCKTLKMWYCDYCKKYHFSNVAKFDYTDGWSDCICSLGIIAYVENGRLGLDNNKLDVLRVREVKK